MLTDIRSAYTGAPNSPINTKHPVWQTENADLQGAWTTGFASGSGSSAGLGLLWAERIYDAITKANVSAYLYWVGVQGGATNSKLIRISDDKTQVIASKRLWAFANWSRHVRPGAVRVGTSGGPSGARVSAFRNVDGGVAVQIIQSGTGTGSVNVKVPGYVTKRAQAWLTDDSHSCDEQAAAVGSDGSVSANIPGKSMLTVMLESGGS